MTNITRFDPFQQIARFEPFRELEGFTTWPRSLRRLFEEMPTEPDIKIDVSEDDKAYTVKADLPGVKKEDIAVEVEGNLVSISAEVKRETEEKKDEKVVHSERYFGSQCRSFTLAQEIDRNKVQAKFDNGVLQLILPKAGGVTPKRIAIS